jgi:hypothetical protein
MPSPTEISTVALAIQLSVAPVFLLTGIGAMLSVITNRIGRIVDRSRAINNSSQSGLPELVQEISVLKRRVRWVHWAVSLCTMSALLICIVIAALFIGSEIGMDPSRVVSLFFISAMLALISGLICFLREIYLATSNSTLRKQ